MNKEQIRLYIKDSLRGEASARDVLAPNLFKGLIERQLDAVIAAMDVFLFDSPGPYDTRASSPGRFNFVKMCREILGPIGVIRMEVARNSLNMLLMEMRSHTVETWREFSSANQKGEK